jgi:hypothetical protein
MGHVTEDPPGPARAQGPDLVADAERDLAPDDQTALLVRVAVLGDDRIGRQLHDRDRQLLAVNPARRDAVPDPDRRHLPELDEVRHRISRSCVAGGVRPG